MSEQARKDEPKGVASAPLEGAASQESSEEVTRRAFIRRTAEVAAFSLFGVLELDAVVEKVLQEMGEISLLRSLAQRTGEILHEAGIGAMAFAAEGCNCPPGQGNPFNCPPGRNFTCTGASNFTCPVPLPGQLGFQCNAFNFECTGASFACTPPFFCEPGYLCPSQAEYKPDCNPQAVSCGIEAYDCNPAPGMQFNCGAGTDDYDCNASNRFDLQCRNAGQYKECPPTQDTYKCGVEWIFDCGLGGMDTKFSCLSGKFVCNGGTLFDFRCQHRFSCDGGFGCRANHVFSCGQPPGMGNSPGSFECADGNFTCAAGGNRCNLPGTGTYDPELGGDTRPGDFYCVGAVGETMLFKCTTDFDCEAVDDFKCMGADREVQFICANPNHFTCAPRSGGSFVCNQGSGHYTGLTHGPLEAVDK